VTGKLQRLKQLTRESMEPAETRPGDLALEGGPFGPHAHYPDLALPPLAPADRGPQRIRLTRLRFHPEQQPRDMLTPAAWESLLAEDANDPSGTLERVTHFRRVWRNGAVEMRPDAWRAGRHLARPGAAQLKVRNTV
jgi:hypothetical protein